MFFTTWYFSILSNNLVRFLKPKVLESKLGEILRRLAPIFEMYASSSSLAEISKALSIIERFIFVASGSTTAISFAVDFFLVIGIISCSAKRFSENVNISHD